MPSIHEWMTTETPDGKHFSFGLDDDANLYVNGQRVVTEQKVALAWWVNLAVILGGLGAFAQGVVAVVTLCK